MLKKILYHSVKEHANRLFMGDLVKGNECIFAGLMFILGENLTSQPTESISVFVSSGQKTNLDLWEQKLEITQAEPQTCLLLFTTFLLPLNEWWDHTYQSWLQERKHQPLLFLWNSSKAQKIFELQGLAQNTRASLLISSQRGRDRSSAEVR